MNEIFTAMSAFQVALDRWLGNNGNAEQEEAFFDGWKYSIKLKDGEEPDLSEGFGYPYDWKAGCDAGIRYKRSL